MLVKERALELIQESFNSLRESGMLDIAIEVKDETVLLGTGSSLDSLGFVNFVTDLEDRLIRETGKDMFFVLDDIQDFNMNNPYLSAQSIATYIARLANGGTA